MFAARREHLDKLIIPALEAGKWVVSDRFTDASYAYQGGGRNLNREKLQVLEQWVQGEFQPDLTLLFDLPTDIAGERLSKMGSAPDRFELETREFFERVRAAYLERAAMYPGRIKVINAQQSLENIYKQLEVIVASNCNK